MAVDRVRFVRAVTHVCIWSKLPKEIFSFLLLPLSCCDLSPCKNGFFIFQFESGFSFFEDSIRLSKEGVSRQCGPSVWIVTGAWISKHIQLWKWSAKCPNKKCGFHSVPWEYLRVRDDRIRFQGVHAMWTVEARQNWWPGNPGRSGCNGAGRAFFQPSGWHGLPACLCSCCVHDSRCLFPLVFPGNHGLIF